jgi:putative ABC transport system permease protein
LLTVAGLLGQSFLRLQGTDPGFRPEGVLVARLALPRDRYATRDSVQQFAQKILPRVSALPGARSAALGQVLPLSAMNVRADFSVVGHPPATPAEKPAAQNRWVSPGWLQTLGIPLLQGRDFSERDDGRAPGVAIADAALVRRHLGGLQPVGTRLLLEDGPEPREVEIVGVAGEVKHFALDEEPTPTLYTPAAQLTADALPFFTGRVQVVVRAAGLAPSALREAVRELDASVPADVRALDEVLVAALAPRKFQALLLLLFSGAALALAATGLYGLMAWSVAQRTREIGVRLALGATPRRVVGMVVGEGVRLAFIGLGAGLLLSAAAARLLPALLPGVVGSDVVGFLAPPLVLVAVAGAASWLAARRAASVDPAESLRAG